MDYIAGMEGKNVITGTEGKNATIVFLYLYLYLYIGYGKKGKEV